MVKGKEKDTILGLREFINTMRKSETERRVNKYEEKDKKNMNISKEEWNRHGSKEASKPMKYWTLKAKRER